MLTESTPEQRVETAEEIIESHSSYHVANACENPSTLTSYLDVVCHNKEVSKGNPKIESVPITTMLEHGIAVSGIMVLGDDKTGDLRLWVTGIRAELNLSEQI